MDIAALIGAVVTALAMLFSGDKDDDKGGPGTLHREITELRVENALLRRVLHAHGLDEEMP